VEVGCLCVAACPPLCHGGGGGVVPGPGRRRAVARARPRRAPAARPGRSLPARSAAAPVGRRAARARAPAACGTMILWPLVLQFGRACELATNTLLPAATPGARPLHQVVSSWSRARPPARARARAGALGAAGALRMGGRRRGALRGASPPPPTAATTGTTRAPSPTMGAGSCDAGAEASRARPRARGRATAAPVSTISSTLPSHRLPPWSSLWSSSPCWLSPVSGGQAGRRGPN
jgi:hypothetical protein